MVALDIIREVKLQEEAVAIILQAQEEHTTSQLHSLISAVAKEQVLDIKELDKGVVITEELAAELKEEDLDSSSTTKEAQGQDQDLITHSHNTLNTIITISEAELWRQQVMTSWVIEEEDISKKSKVLNKTTFELWTKIHTY